MICVGWLGWVGFNYFSFWIGETKSCTEDIYSVVYTTLEAHIKQGSNVTSSPHIHPSYHTTYFTYSRCCTIYTVPGSAFLVVCKKRTRYMYCFSNVFLYQPRYGVLFLVYDLCGNQSYRRGIPPPLLLSYMKAKK